MRSKDTTYSSLSRTEGKIYSEHATEEAVAAMVAVNSNFSLSRMCSTRPQADKVSLAMYR